MITHKALAVVLASALTACGGGSGTSDINADVTGLSDMQTAGEPSHLAMSLSGEAISLWIDRTQMRYRMEVTRSTQTHTDLVSTGSLKADSEQTYTAEPDGNSRQRVLFRLNAQGLVQIDWHLGPDSSGRWRNLQASGVERGALAVPDGTYNYIGQRCQDTVCSSERGSLLFSANGLWTQCVEGLLGDSRHPCRDLRSGRWSINNQGTVALYLAGQVAGELLAASAPAQVGAPTIWLNLGGAEGLTALGASAARSDIPSEIRGPWRYSRSDLVTGELSLKPFEVGPCSDPPRGDGIALPIDCLNGPEHLLPLPEGWFGRPGDQDVWRTDSETAFALATDYFHDTFSSAPVQGVLPLLALNAYMAGAVHTPWPGLVRTASDDVLLVSRAGLLVRQHREPAGVISVGLR